MNIASNRTLASILEHQAHNQPDTTFLVFAPFTKAATTLSYREFNNSTDNIASGLISRGISKGDRVHIQLPNCVEFLLVWFACAKAGAILVPTSSDATLEETSYILEHSQASISIQDRDAVHELASNSDRLERTTVQNSLDDVAMMYTSGTTSKPKGVLITHSAYIYGGECMAKATALTPEDRHLVTLPLFHAAAQCHAVIPTLLVGGTLILAERFSASRFFDQAIEHRATAAALFGAPIRMILAQTYNAQWQENALRFVTYAQNITQEQWDLWHARFRVPLLQLWGMTETVGLPLMNPLFGERKPMSMGKPVLGYECAIVDDSGMEVDPCETGELVVSVIPGVNAMRGYYQNPDATAETLLPVRDTPMCRLMTGDRARMDEDGYFYFVDRAKDLIKRAGENISSSEVESVIKSHPSVFDAAVIGVPDAMRDEAVKAFVIVRDGGIINEEEIRMWCAERLSRFKIPEYVEFVDEFPRTSVGKIQKHLLRNIGV